MSRLVPLAKELENRGAGVVLAVRDVPGAREELQNGALGDGEHQIAVIQAPLVQPKALPLSNIAPSLAHALCRFGYADPDALFPAVKAWHSLVRRLNPSLVVLDSAPTAGLVCRGRFPTVSVGNGWTLPPSGPLPPLVHNGDPAEPEQAILSAVALMTSNNGFRQPHSLSDLMRGDESLIYTLPELDPYRPWRDSPVFRPYNVPLVKTSAASRHEIFVYLPAHHPSASQVVGCLSTTKIPARVWCGGLASLAVVKNVKLLSQPADMSDALQRSKLIIHHGGLGTAAAALMAGVPQISIPIHLEHKLTSKSIIALGVGGVMPSLQFDIQSLRQLILAFLTPELTARALAVAQIARTCPDGNGVGGLADRCVSVMTRR
ncbi:MAG TPA: nucleotide disphospho-sugar-binding domain-containing protein [Magnetospirillum sp.]|nr:nucleotide disphospho-sugar-binding domain-containing protein [Magnetospirillum sp.]